MSDILQRFSSTTEWVDLSNLLERLKREFKQYPQSLIPQKKELAKRLGQCLSPRFSEVHSQALDIYKEVFCREKEISISVNGQSQAVFGEYMGLFVSNLYNFYEIAGFEVKRAFLDLVDEHILSFEQELLMSLGTFLQCILPALDDSNEDMLMKVHKILHRSEKIVGTAKLFGEIWKTVLRSPRTRVMGLKYLNDKIPRDVDEVAALNKEIEAERQSHKKQQIYRSPYNVTIDSGVMLVDMIDYDSDQCPDWAKQENQKLQILRLAPAQKNYEQRFQEKSLDRQELLQRQSLCEAMIYFYYPNRSDLVLNAILSGLYDRDNNLAVRASFDFLITHVPINSDLLGSKEDRVKLMEASLLTLIKKDFACQKRFFSWTFDNLPDCIDENDPQVTSCTMAFKNILMRFANLKSPSERVYYGQQRQEENQYFNHSHPIVVLLKVFQDEDMGDIHQAILKEITQPLIEYIYTLYNDSSLPESNKRKLEDNVNNLFELIDHYQSTVWTQLGSLLRDQIERIKHGQSEIEVSAIDLIICCLDKLFKQDEDARTKRQQRSLGNTGKCTKQENLKIQKTLAEIASILLKNFQTLTDNYHQLQHAIPALKLLQRMLKDMKQEWSKQDMGNKKQQTAAANLEEGVLLFNNFFAELIHKLQIRKRVLISSPDLETLRLASQIICEIQMYADPDSYNSDRQDQGRIKWLEQVGNCALQEGNQTVQVVAVDVLIKIIEQKIDKDQGLRAKRNIIALQNIISPNDLALMQKKKTLELEENDNSGLIDFDPDDEIGSFKELNNFVEELEDHDLFSPKLSFPDNRSEQEDLGQSKTDLIPRVIGKLWSLLGQTGDHYEIVQLLKKFDKLKPEIFSNVIIEELCHHDREVKKRAVEKFATFWKIATDKKSKSQYLPFHQAALKQTGKRRDYDALHKILMILEDKDPTLRLATRSWLQDSSQDFSKILDPILKEFMSNNKMSRSYTGQLFFEKEYNAEYVKENFTKLRNIILMTEADFVKYICLNKHSSDIEKDFNQVIQYIEGPDFTHESTQIKCNSIKGLVTDSKKVGKGYYYIICIVYLTLQFIMGQYVSIMDDEQKNEALYQDTQVVNASACELMELIIRSISQYEKICIDIIHLIIERLVNTLRVAIDSGNDAQQVILLNLLKVILFEHERLFYPTNQRESQNLSRYHTNAQNLLQSKSFVSCFIDGLQSGSSIVRYHYILFTQKLVPLMQKILPTEQLVEVANQMIDCFSGLLLKSDVSRYESNVRARKTIIIDDELDHEDEYTEQQANSNRYDPEQQNLVIDQENEILQLIKGFSTVLNQFLGNEISEKAQSQEQQQRLQDLGVAAQQDQGVLSWIFGTSQTINEDANRQLKEALADKSQMIMKACLNCWNDLDLFRAREFFFSPFGLFGFNEEDLTVMDKRLKQSQEPRKSWYSNIPNPENQESTKQAKTSREKFTKYIKQNCNRIQQKIIAMLHILAKNNPQSIIEALVITWLEKMKSLRNSVVVQGSKQMIFAQRQRKSQECENILQLILSMQLPTHLVLSTVNSLVERKEWKQSRRKGVLVMNKEEFELAELESSLCQFVYAYLMHNLQFIQITKQLDNTDEFVKSRMRLYTQTSRFIDNFKWTRHPNTTCWLMEILHILSNKFVAPQAMGESEQQEKLELQLSFLLNSAACIINDIAKLDFAQANGQYLLSGLHLSPTVYETLKRFEFSETKKQSTADRQNVIKFPLTPGILSTDERQSLVAARINADLTFSSSHIKNLKHLPVPKDSQWEDLEHDWFEKDSSLNTNSPVEVEKSKFVHRFLLQVREKAHNRQQSNQDLNDVFRVFTVITLRQVLTQITKRVHSTGQDQVQIQKRRKAESIIVNAVMNQIQTQIQSESPNESPDSFNNVFFEILTELLRSVTAVQHQVQTHYKVQIEAIFKEKGFFQMNERSLRKWQKIMQKYSTTNQDLWTNLLRNFDSQGGFFRGNRETMKLQSEIFRQLSFLIFSTKEDQIGANLDPLLKKMVESFKASDKAESFVISLFLLSRILMLRLSKRTLIESTKKFGPHLLAELVSVFDASSDTVSPIVKKEAIKVVELMSQLDIDEFQFNQWMFIFDGFGISYQANGESIPLVQNIASRDSSRKKATFQPYLVQFMQKGHFNVYDSMKDSTQQENKAETFLQIVPCQMNQPLFYDFNQVEVQTYATQLQCKYDLANTTSMRLDCHAADTLIEKDFLKKSADDEKLINAKQQTVMFNLAVN